MKDYKILALDMDGTVVYGYEHISPVVALAIKQAINKGVKVLFNTGRSHNLMVHHFAEVGLEQSDTLQISNCGTTLTRPNGELHSVYSADTEDYKILIDRLEALAIPFSVSNGINAYRSPFVSDDNKDYGNCLVCDDLRTLPNACRVALRSNMATVAKAVEGLKFQCANSIEDYFDIWPKDIDKGTGLTEVAKHYNVSMSEVIAIGDGDNDLGMLRVAGLALVMGQGSERAKQMAHQVIPSVSEDGVAWAINRYILNQNAQD